MTRLPIAPLVVGLILLTPLARTAPAQQRTTVWIGSTASKQAGGIYRCELDLASGALSKPVQMIAGVRAGFLARDRRRPLLISTSNRAATHPNSSVDVFEIGDDHKLSLLDSASSGGRGACHTAITPDGKTVLVANYGSGSVTAIALDKDHEFGAASTIQHEGSSVNEARQRSPHAHVIRSSHDGRHAYVCDLGTDHVWCYAIEDRALRLLDKAMVPEGSGPRHLRVSDDGARVFVLNELTLTVTTFARSEDRGKLSDPQTTDLLRPDESREQMAASEIAMHPQRPLLYCAVRDLAAKKGDTSSRDAIVVLRIEDDATLTRVQRHRLGLPIPRHFAIDPSGRWLVCAGQKSDRVAVFPIDPDSGLLGPRSCDLELATPMCIVLDRATQPR